MGTTKDDWHREPKHGEEYLFFTSSKKIGTWRYSDTEIDKLRFKRFEIFPVKDDYTIDELIADRVPDMSYLERMAYQFGHRYGDWLTDEERLSEKIQAYGVTYNCDISSWVIRCFLFSSSYKMFTKEETAGKLCEYLNANCDHTGHLKGE